MLVSQLVVGTVKELFVPSKKTGYHNYQQLIHIHPWTYDFYLQSYYSPHKEKNKGLHGLNIDDLCLILDYPP